MDGQIFVAWQDKRGDTPLDDYFSSTTTFTMGDNDVAYSASLRDLKVPYTDESKAEPGQTLTVDESYFEELADESIKMLEAYENGLGYQWYEDGKAIKGATKKSLKIEDPMIGGDIKATIKMGDIEFYTETVEVSGAAPQPPPAQASEENPFEDVSKSDSYYDAVMWAYNAEPQVTNGTDLKHFSPKDTVNRGQCVTFLWRAMGCPEPKSSDNSFSDIESGMFYYKAVLWAVEKGITKGVDASHFDPDAPLSTQHIVTFIYRTLNSGKDGWGEEAKEWAGRDYGGDPFGVDIGVDNTVNCPLWCTVQFLYEALTK